MSININREEILTHPPYKRGFTLAETLITLVIIGIVAALTVPNLIIKHQKEETVTRLKKTYSTLAQITDKAIADHGPILSWAIDNNSENFFNTYMAPYLSISKVCGYTNQSNCDLKYAYMSSPKTFYTYPNYYYSFILSDGSAVTMWTMAAGNAQMSVAFASINIDINGAKGPNVLGKDIFQYVYWFRNSLSTDTSSFGKLTPTMFTSTRNQLKGDCNKINGDGYACAALIMKDGWQIKDDYPW